MRWKTATETSHVDRWMGRRRKRRRKRKTYLGNEVVFPKGRGRDFFGHTGRDEFILRVDHEKGETWEDAEGTSCVEDLLGGWVGGWIGWLWEDRGERGDSNEVLWVGGLVVGG